MNDMDQLSAVSDHDAAHLVSEDAFADLADQIAAHPQRKPSAGLRWRPAVLPVAAAVTVAALAAGAILTVHGQSARTGTRPAPAPAVRPATTAARLVAYATRNAATEAFDPQPRQWIYTSIRTATSTRHGRGTTYEGPFQPVSYQSWERLDGKEYAYLQDGKLQHSGGSGLFVAGSSYFGWPDMHSYSYLESLPTSPARLTAIIKSNLRADKQDPMRQDPVDGGVAVFEAVQTLLEDVVVLPPRLRAGLYGVLAHDPAVRFHPSVTDYAGQRGAAFSTSLDNGHTENLIVVSTRTYAYMGLKQVALKTFTQTENDGTYHYHKGQIMTLQAVLGAGIVDHPGQRP